MSLDGLLESLIIALVPAVAGLVGLVLHHGRAIAALQARVDAIAEIKSDVRQLTSSVSDVAVGVERLHGDVRALSARTDELLRTTARHEAFLFRTDSDARAKP